VSRRLARRPANACGLSTRMPNHTPTLDLHGTFHSFAHPHLCWSTFRVNFGICFYMCSHRFLRRVCRHELLRKDIHVVVFLEFAEEIQPINKTSWWHSPWYVPRHGVVDDAEGVTVRVWANRYASGPIHALPRLLHDP
jgi:hypothetical protein